MRARKTCASCMISARVSGVATTLIMARSRNTDGVDVTFSTRCTCTNLYRLASIRIAPPSSVSTTIVMRETPGFSVCPTVSDSMLKPRRRNSDATRFKTPGLFSTWTTSVISIFSSQVLRSFNQRTGTTNHGVKIGARGHHWEDRVLLLHAEINHVCTAMFTRVTNRWKHVGTLPDRRTGQIKCSGELHEIRAIQRSSLVSAFVEKFLPLPHHPQITIVDNGNLDFKTLLRDRGQFSHRHLESAVASHDPNFRVGPRELGPDSRGQGESHRA